MRDLLKMKNSNEDYRYSIVDSIQTMLYHYRNAKPGSSSHVFLEDMLYAAKKILDEELDGKDSFNNGYSLGSKK